MNVSKIMVAYTSPKRSRKVISVAKEHALASNAEIILVRVMADPSKVGVIAELISSDEPAAKAQGQMDAMVQELLDSGLKARGLLKIGSVGETLVSTAIEEKVDMVYLGAAKANPGVFCFFKDDPIMHYLVDNCPTSLCIIRSGGAELEAD
jgi:nucleotide-binding universal stress UspA family protein